MTLARLIGTVLGAGYIRPASGTWGSLAALPAAWVIYLLAGPFGLLAGVIISYALGVWATGVETKGKDDLEKEVNTLLENPFTPLDRCFTLSALLGRLRDDLALPSIRKPSPAVLAAAAGNANKKKKANNPFLRFLLFSLF